ncbi:hypothetical protein F5B17DRAFT_339039 [Nemania serpens]|nr:hypothetical protein F5B17DRAFT_339039 [Nemania serpens]
MSTTSKGSLVQSPPSPSPTCICDAETQHIIGIFAQKPDYQSSATSSSSSSASSSSQSLPAMLKRAQVLVKHWGDVNGCPNAGAHLNERMLYTMTDAIGAILSDYEVAVGLILLSQSSASQNCRRDRSDTNNGVGENHMPKAMIGELELELAERAIVVQQAVKHSVLRLAAVMQDIEEEAALATRSSKGESSLHDRGVKELITRLFRLLGTVNQIGCTDNMD